jgi:UDP-N-acetylmuramoylalanine--D-glutamate ligase
VNKKEIHSRLRVSNRLLPIFFPNDSIFSAKHFLDNFGAAKTLASVLGIHIDIFNRVAKSFKGLPHRLFKVATKKSIVFVDDAISTNPDSTLAGAKYFNNRLGSIILGGQDRGQDFKELITYLKNKNIFAIVLESETSKKIFSDAKDLNFDTIVVAKDMGQAVSLGFRNTEKGKVCLLSTAAPSYGLYRNYEEKGETFKKQIKAYR